MSEAMKRSRRSTPRAKTGCLTCKIRHIKCDEQRPACLKCTRTGRRCDGYENTIFSQMQARRPASITTYSIPFRVPGSKADRQLLHYYCCQAADNLSSYSDPALWTTLILQRSHHEPVIRSALVTLSSLYQDYLAGDFTCPGTDSLPPPSALQRIAKSHRQLRLYLSNPGASPEVALICSIIFYAFETLVGNTQQAIRHLDLGLVLLQRCQNDSCSSMSKPDDILPHLAALLSCLDIQASIYDPSRGAPMLKLVSSSETRGIHDVVPHTLLSDAQGEAVLTKLQNWMTSHLAVHANVKDVPETTPPEILHERAVLERQFQRYLDAIEKLSEGSGKKDDKRILLLRIQTRMYYGVLLQRLPWPCCVSTNAGLSLSHSKSTPMTAQPQSVPENGMDAALSEISTLLDTSSQGTDCNSRPFTLSTQLVLGLYYACLKTANQHTLETALTLLRHPHLPSRDGLWDAKAAASVVEGLLAQARREQDTDDQSLSALATEKLD